MAGPLDMTGRVVIVTGGTRGIGRGLARRFLEAGADVLVCGRSDVDELPAAGARRAHFARADVRAVEQIESVIRLALQRLARIDVLVSNAGGSPPAAAATASLESLDDRHDRIHLKPFTAKLRADGSMRVVVAHSDPGVEKWLDTCGHAQGTMCWRWVGAVDPPEPRTRVVPIAELRLE